jgi:hypothetical protein
MTVHVKMRRISMKVWPINMVLSRHFAEEMKQTTTSRLDKLATGFRMKCKTWMKNNCTIFSTMKISDAQDILVCKETQCMVVLYDFEPLHQNMQNENNA